MSKANLTKDLVQILSGRDGIVVRKNIAGLEAGRVLDIDDASVQVIPCGTPIASKTTSGTVSYKPVIPADTTSGGTTTYALTLPEGYAYAGIAAATVRANQPCPVMIAGVVNETAMLDNLTETFPSAMETPTALSLTALKSACPHLIFTNDEVA